MIAVNLPLADIPFADVMAERLGLPVFVDNDANAGRARRAPGRRRARRREAVMLTIGTGIGGGLILRGELYRGAIGAAGELGHMVIDMDGPPCQGNCPNRRLPRGAGLRHGAGPRGPAARRASAPTPASAGRWPSGRELAGPLVTELAHDGDPAALEVLDADRQPARGGDRQLRQHLQPRGGGDRRRRDRAPASCCSSRPAPRWPSARAAAARATWSGSSPRASASRRG